MFDMFTKSKTGIDVIMPVLEFADLTGSEGPWHIAHAIDHALESAETARAAIVCKVEEATAWAAVSLGNGNDEYLERETLDTKHLNRFDRQIRDGHQHVARLDRNIAQYRILKAALVASFPELNKKAVIAAA